MATRLGGGEYERANVDTKQSAKEARFIFLQALAKRKNQCFFNLLRLFSSDQIPSELLENDKIDNLFYFFFPYLLRKSPYNTETPPQIIDTPILHYYSFFFDKEDEIKRLENGDGLQPNSISLKSITRRNNALKKIVPNWQELKRKKDAESLCKSLEAWAKEYNLNDDWCLDFALDILRKFKSKFDFRLPSFDGTDLSNEKIKFFHASYEKEVESSIFEAVLDYRRNEILVYTYSCFDDAKELPTFEYRWRDFDVQRQIWLPRISSRKEFVAEMYNQLERAKNLLYDAIKLWGYSNKEELLHLEERCRIWLENYCNHLEQKADEIDIKPIVIKELGEFTWLPSKKSREQFIEETLAELKNLIIKINKAVKSLETFTKADFETKLTKYCNAVEKSLPKTWIRTPQKYSEDKHFDWLVDFQVSPYKSYAQIAKENNTELNSVRGAIKILADLIGITLRKSKRTGRPKGSKNEAKSLRQLGIFKS